MRSNDVQNNYCVVGEVFEKYAILAPALELCPKFPVILAHMLVLRLGWQVRDVDFTSNLSEWDHDDCRNVGSSMATFMRTFQQGNTAIDAWRRQYPQLNNLFDEVEGG